MADRITYFELNSQGKVIAGIKDGGALSVRPAVAGALWT